MPSASATTVSRRSKATATPSSIGPSLSNACGAGESITKAWVYKIQRHRGVHRYTARTEGKQKLEPNGLMQAVRKGMWKAVKMGSNQPLLLYDLSQDLGEQNDLSKQHPDIAKAMAELMKRSRTEMLPQRELEMPKGKQYR